MKRRISKMIPLFMACFIFLSTCQNDVNAQKRRDTSESPNIEAVTTIRPTSMPVPTDNGDKFVGKWKRVNGAMHFEVLKQGDLYLLDGEAMGYGKRPFKYKEGELTESTLGSMVYDQTNGHVYFVGYEFGKLSDDIILAPER